MMGALLEKNQDKANTFYFDKAPVWQLVHEKSR